MFSLDAEEDAPWFWLTLKKYTKSTLSILFKYWFEILFSILNVSLAYFIYYRFDYYYNKYSNLKKEVYLLQQNNAYKNNLEAQKINLVKNLTEDEFEAISHYKQSQIFQPTAVSSSKSKMSVGPGISGQGWNHFSRSSRFYRGYSQNDMIEEGHLPPYQPKTNIKKYATQPHINPYA